MANQDDEIEHISAEETDNIYTEEIHTCPSEDEIHCSLDFGNNSADEDDLNTTNSSLAYLTQVREARKKVAVGEPRRTCTTRVVACTAVGFLLVCFLMVGISLLMSKNIDSLGKFLTIKAPITTAADDIHKYVFIVLQGK